MAMGHVQVQIFRDWEELQEPPRKRMTIFALTANVSGKLLTNHIVKIVMSLLIQSPHTKEVSLLVRMCKHQTQPNLIWKFLLAENIWKGHPPWSWHIAKFSSMNESMCHNIRACSG